MAQELRLTICYWSGDSDLEQPVVEMKDTRDHTLPKAEDKLERSPEWRQMEQETWTLHRSQMTMKVPNLTSMDTFQSKVRYHQKPRAGGLSCLLVELLYLVTSRTACPSSLANPWSKANVRAPGHQTNS